MAKAAAVAARLRAIVRRHGRAVKDELSLSLLYNLLLQILPVSGRSWLGRVTKIGVIASILGIVIFEVIHAGLERPFLPALALLAAVTAYAVGRKDPERAVGAVLLASFLTPALLHLTIGYRFRYFSIWTAAFLGAMAATTRSEWQYPPRLRFPLIAWALAIALTWPIVALRVLDWNPSAMWTWPSTRSAPMHAIQLAVWISDVALVHLLGLLWIDWLFGRFAPEAVERFERVIIYPLLASATVAALVGVYQGFVDLGFLTTGGWILLGRASGALIDANPSGALTALWVPIALGFAVRARSGLVTGALALCSVLLLVATWTSGSRTAFLCALVGLVAFVHIALRERVSRRKLLIASAVTAAVLAATWTGLAPSVQGPVRRVSEILPSLSSADIRSAARRLWEREGYGTAAMAMIADEPLQGVGVGTFHMMSTDYFFAISNKWIPSDNAQNWFRHQFAELGLLGSVGWIWWSAILTAAIFSGTRATASPASSLVVKYTIAGFGMASLLGMPSQNLLVALAVWTFAFWLLLMTGGTAKEKSATAHHRAVVAALALALVFAATTAYAGWRELRPPFIAKRLNYLYQYGLYQPMEGMSGQVQTSAHGVVVPSAPTTALRLTVWVEHPDADKRPVEVGVWLDGRRIIRGHFPRNVPLTRVVPVPGANKRFVLETRVDRTFASPETRQPDIGLTFEWEFQEPG